MEVRKYETILTELENTMTLLQSRITDFSDGSVITSILSAVARQLERVYIAIKNGYTANLLTLATSVFGIVKKEGTTACVGLLFEVKTDATVAPIIPAGATVSGGGASFRLGSPLTLTAVLEDGKVVGYKGVCKALATVAGAKGNVALGAVSTIDTDLALSVSITVKNITEGTGGTDGESDKSFQLRFKNYLNGLQKNNIYGIKYAVQSLPQVRSVAIQEHFPPKDAFNATIFVDDGTGGIDKVTKDAIREVLDGSEDGARVGIRSAGVKFDIQGAETVYIAVQVSCFVYGKDSFLAKQEVEETIKNYINNLGIGEAVVLTTIIHALRSLYYIKDVRDLSVRVVGSDGLLQDNVNNNNIEVGANTIARLYNGEDKTFNAYTIKAWVDEVAKGGGV